MNAVLNDAHVTAWLAWLKRLEAQLWTLDGFDSHVADWLAQLPKSREQKQYEDDFPLFEKLGELLDERELLKSARKSQDSPGKESTDRLLSRLEEDVKILYTSLELGPDGKPQTAPVATDEIDLDMVTTRKELVDAFGKFTGMSLAWFDNLKDSPKLKAARKYTGKGGRHIAEPLFCPYEVMQWLIDPKRKKGKPLNDSTAWRLLKGSFGKVYNLHSIGDPNAD